MVQPEPLSKLRLFFATISVSVGTLLISLDQFVANVSMPTISGDLGVSQDNGTWIITSYVVANATMIPLTGWLSAILGQVRLFTISAILFAIMSLLCGMSTSFTMLISCRVLQGFVSGGLIPLSQSLLLMLYPKKRAFALGLWGLVVMVGPAIGPVIGGWLTYTYSWPWIFYINVPLGIVAGLLTLLLLSPYETARTKRGVDWVGILLLILTVGSYQIMLDRGYDDDWFNSHFIRALAITSIIGFCVFIVWERFHEDPVVDLSFFKSRNFTVGSLTIGFSMWLVIGSLVITPNWVQDALGYTQLWAGYVIAPFGIAAFFFFPLVGNYMHLMDARIWIAIGFALIIPPFFYMSNLSIWTPFENISMPRIIQGIGFAFFYVPLTTISLSGIPMRRMADAAGIFSFIRLLFISAGVSLNANFYNRRENFYQSRYAERVIPSNPQWQIYTEALEQNLGLTGQRADAFIYENMINQAYTETYLEMNYLWGWGFIILSLSLLFFRSIKTAEERALHLHID